MARHKNINQEENFSQQFSVSISPQYMDKLAALCKKEKRKRGAMVRIMIEEWFEGLERERKRELEV
jgi:predicted DNA-binding protein